MGWDNEEWAARHIRKHGTTLQEAWEVAYGDSKTVILRARDQLNYPPFVRYWTVGHTKAGRQLMIVWDKYRETKNPRLSGCHLTVSKLRCIMWGSDDANVGSKTSTSEFTS